MSELTCFVGVPTRGQVDTQVAAAVSQLAVRLGTAPHYERGHLSAGMTRNMIVDKFLQTGMDVLVMVDDDVVASPHAHKIVDHLGEFDVVGAAYPVFKPELGWPIPVPPCFSEINGDYEITQGSGLTECDAIGTGCVAIRREVLEGLAPAFAEVMSDNGQIISDDFVFCKKARDAGFRVAMDFDVRCDHLVTVSLGAVLVGINQHVRYRESVLAGV